MNRSLPVALALAVAFLALPAPARAGLITVNFTVTGDPNDPVNAGQTATGHFSLDSDLRPSPDPGIPIDRGDYATSIHFMWDGVTWNTTNATLYELRFDSVDGALITWAFGGDVNGVDGVNSLSDDFAMGGGGMFYATGDDHFYNGTVSWSAFYAPEPSTLVLLPPGLLALGLIRRRRG